MGRILKKEALLHQLYYDPSTGFGGIQELYKTAKRRLKSITLEDVQRWLRSQRTYTLHKPIRRKFKRRQTVVAGIDHQWQADLADLQSVASYNSPFRYLLCVIDVFSKYAWVIPIVDKSGKTLIQAFKSILKDRKPLSLQTDKGREFLNKEFQSFLDQHDIHFFTSENPETKASVVERFQRTLKTRMWKYFTHHKTRRYVDVLQQLVKAYNKRFHRSIGRAPDQVSPENEHEVTEALYGKQPKNHLSDLKVGEVVRINKTKRTFDKGYLPNWTTEVFKVVRVNKTHPVTFNLEDLGGEAIAGSFYLDEIQRIKDDGIYEVESILDRRTRRVDGKAIREVKVHWLGYPSKFDSWIPATHLV